MAGGGGGLVRQLLVDARLLGPDVHRADAPLSDAARMRGVGAGGGRGGVEDGGWWGWTGAPTSRRCSATRTRCSPS